MRSKTVGWLMPAMAVAGVTITMLGNTGYGAAVTIVGSVGSVLWASRESRRVWRAEHQRPGALVVEHGRQADDNGTGSGR